MASHLYLYICTILFANDLLQVAASVHVPTLRQVGSPNATCPADEDLTDARNQLRQNIVVSLGTTYPCGNSTGWRRVGYLDMTDSSQSCPPGLAFKSNSGLRLCGRVDTNSGCWSTTYNTSGLQYRSVCGRVRGYQNGATSAFAYSSRGIESYYIEGVSLTYGAVGNRKHIWSFASGLSYVYGGAYATEHCTCAYSGGRLAPAFVGNDYFCESGLQTPWVNTSPWLLYSDDPLWDGQNCGATSCCQFNNPPYFTKTLPAPTSEDIELRLCAGHGGEHHTPMDQMELYVK